MNDTDLKKEIIERLDELSAKMDTLTQIVAISPKLETILRDKTKTQQIELLSDFGLLKEAIALIVDTTPETVGVRISEMKRKKRKKGKRKGE